MSYTPSVQQQNYFTWVQDDTGSLVLEAAAGAGKSTTLVQGLRYMEGSIFLGAYNKRASEDLKSKAEKLGLTRKGLFISTMHGAGYSAFRRAYPEVQVDENKVRDIIDAMHEANPTAGIANMEAYLRKMVSIGKQMLCGVKWEASNFAIWEKLADHFGYAQDLPEDVEVKDTLDFVREAFIKSANLCPTMIDFDDMIWAPLGYNVRFFTNDWVIIDEAQDTNPARRELAKRMLKPRTGRLVAVADARQAIYGFQGADHDAVDLIVKEFSCKRLPLSVTYRCPKDIVAYAHNFVPVGHIQAHETAPQGEVRMVLQGKTGDGKRLPWFVTDQPMAQDAIICRYTKPLVSTAFAMLRVGIACKVEGRDIGNGLIKLAQRWKVKTLDALEGRLDTWCAKMVAKAKAKRSAVAEQSAIDLRDTLQVFIDRCRAKGQHSIQCLVTEILALFADNVTGVTTLMTGHRSKGREFPTVFWLEVTDFERPGSPVFQAIQEQNVKYVIATRAQERLIRVPEAAWGTEK